jgi:hypothetical protein
MKPKWVITGYQEQAKIDGSEQRHGLCQLWCEHLERSWNDYTGIDVKGKTNDIGQ